MKNQASARTAATEFPEIIIDVKIPAHWEDTSWHNDTCPSFHISDVVVTSEGNNGYIRVYVDHANEDEREVQESARFGVCLLDEDMDYLEDVMNTNSWLEVLTAVKQLEGVK